MYFHLDKPENGARAIAPRDMNMLCFGGKNVRIKVNSSVGKLAELSSLLELCGLLSVLRIKLVGFSPHSAMIFAVCDGIKKTYVVGVVSHDCGLVMLKKLGWFGVGCRLSKGECSRLRWWV